MMDKVDDPPQALYSLLMELTPFIIPRQIFTDDKRPYNFVEKFEITTMPSFSILSVKNYVLVFL